MLQLPKIKSENSECLKTMHDTVYESLMSIKNLGVSTANWDPIICHILNKKLDTNTLVHYECQLDNVREPQSLKSMLSYLENRFMALQSATAKQEARNEYKPEYKNDKPSTSTPTSSVSSSVEKIIKCLICGQNHMAIKCNTLLNKSVRD